MRVLIIAPETTWQASLSHIVVCSDLQALNNPGIRLARLFTADCDNYLAHHSWLSNHKYRCLGLSATIFL